MQYMKPVFILLILFIFQVKLNYSHPGRKLAQDTIVWSAERLLTKADFKGKRSSGGVASTSSGLSLRSKDNDGALMLYVVAVFYKSKSYMKGDSQYILKHEQLHFDITELHARKLRQKISEKDFEKVKSVSREIQRSFDEAIRDCEKEQSKYDKETNHSINAAKQKEWSEKIKQQLEELEKYGSTEINIAE